MDPLEDDEISLPPKPSREEKWKVEIDSLTSDELEKRKVFLLTSNNRHLGHLHSYVSWAFWLTIAIIVIGVLKMFAEGNL